jgi:hypothetical protein
MQNRLPSLGKIENGEMRLNDMGNMVDYWWNKLPEKFPNVLLDEYMVMPNHFHGVIVINETPVGAIPCNRPNDGAHRPDDGNHDADDPVDFTNERGESASTMHDKRVSATAPPSENVAIGTATAPPGGHVAIGTAAAPPGENMVSPLRIPNHYDGLGQYVSWFKRSLNRIGRC